MNTTLFMEAKAFSKTELVNSSSYVMRIGAAILIFLGRQPVAKSGKME